jgi:hypothetical protein
VHAAEPPDVIGIQLIERGVLDRAACTQSVTDGARCELLVLATRRSRRIDHLT